jgi:hypothetical protein
VDNAQFVTLDATTEISFDHRALVTEHPVESGLSVTDHVQDLPDRFSVRGVITASPTPNLVNPIAGRVEIARDFLLQAKSDGALLIVQTQRYGSLDNCVLERVGYVVNREQALRLDIAVRRIRLAEVGYVEIAPEAPVAAAQSSMPDEQDVGQQATTTSTATQVDAESGSHLYEWAYGS